MKTTMLLITTVLLIGLSSATPVVGVTQDEESLRLNGCLLLSRRAGIYALHMEYNRIAVIGRADLAEHVGHLVVLTGVFEIEGGYLQFVADDVTHVAPTCEVQASVTVPIVNHA